MSKLYELTGASTYATMTKVFKKGVAYTEEALGAAVSAKSEGGIPYFTEAGANTQPAPVTASATLAVEVSVDAETEEVEEPATPVQEPEVKPARKSVTIGRKGDSDTTVTV